MWWTFLGYFGISIVGGIAACFLGIWMGNKFV
jgi:fluoride ion exporter CrcB/FEX